MQKLNHLYSIPLFELNETMARIPDADLYNVFHMNTQYGLDIMLEICFFKERKKERKKEEKNYIVPT